MKRFPSLRTGLVLAFGLLNMARAEGPASKPVAHEKAFTQEDREHWAFQPVVRKPVPAVKEPAWLRNPVDAFILATLEENGIPHAAEADRSTLLRRVTFDLTGLPPTPEERAAFLADGSPSAYERVIERLLASPEYGVRWGQHWLDLARYADTDGYEFDQVRPNAWRYRDWVVSALNSDIPYDEFIQLQLAGDELHPDDPHAFIATGFNRCYPDMVDLNDQGLRRQNALNDITETTGLVFMGLTIGCARCHDHKFDPIRSSDFYRLQAYFTPSRFVDDRSILSSAEHEARERRLRSWQSETGRLHELLAKLEAPMREQLESGRLSGLNATAIAVIRKPAPERSGTELRKLHDELARCASEALGASTSVPAVDGPLSPAYRDAVQALAALKQREPEPESLARGLATTRDGSARTFVLQRGDYYSKGPEVAPGPPSIFQAGTDESKGASQTAQGLRRSLAAWLTRPDQPLTARVMVNRVWQHHFGLGLVGTPSDFGTMGDSPSHPDLLDWLAAEFVAGGWSLKRLHFLIVTSATYRQSSKGTPEGIASDPENFFVGRHTRTRLDGEAIRDALLAVSGRLNKEQGGPGVFPPLPKELDDVSAKGAVWPVSKAAKDHVRRSLYIFVRRNLRYPFFEAFDRPDTNASCPRRPRTMIAPQALSLLNSRLAMDSANALADRLARESTSDLSSRIRAAYLLALGREPDGRELELGRSFIADENEATWRAYCLALLNLNEFVYID